MPQIVNLDCAICENRISNSATSEFCDSCRQPVHLDCKTDGATDSSHCPACGAIFNDAYLNSVIEEEDDSRSQQERDLRVFVKSNDDYYVDRWIPFLNGHRVGLGFNCPAFLLGAIWLGYRKMYGAAALLFVGLMIIGICEDRFFMNMLGLPSIPVGFSWLIAVLSWFVCGFCANRLYLRHAMKQVSDVQSKKLRAADHYQELSKRGGTSLLRSIGMLAGIFVVFLTALFGVELLANRPIAVINNAEIYSVGVSSDTIEKLGSRLVEVGYLDGTKTTVMCEKVGDSYLVRLVVRAGVEDDPEVIRFFKVLPNDLSEKVFSNHRVEVHLCDLFLKTIRKVVSD